MLEVSRQEGPARVTLGQLALAFLTIGLVAFGGGGTAHIHNAVVRRRGWVSEERFLEGVTFAQITPGPNFSNLAMYVGAQLGGNIGAMVALISLMVPGVTIILLLAIAYSTFPIAQNRWLTGALHGVGAAAVGVLGSVVLQVMPAALRTRGGWPIALCGFFAVGVLGWNIAWVLLALIGVGLLLNRPGQKGPG